MEERKKERTNFFLFRQLRQRIRSPSERARKTGRRSSRIESQTESGKNRQKSPTRSLQAEERRRGGWRGKKEWKEGKKERKEGRKKGKKGRLLPFLLGSRKKEREKGGEVVKKEGQDGRKEERMKKGRKNELPRTFSERPPGLLRSVSSGRGDHPLRHVPQSLPSGLPGSRHGRTPRGPVGLPQMRELVS